MKYKIVCQTKIKSGTHATKGQNRPAQWCGSCPTFISLTASIAPLKLLRFRNMDGVLCMCSVSEHIHACKPTSTNRSRTAIWQ